MTDPNKLIEALPERTRALRVEIAKAIVGQERVVEDVLLGLYCGEHVLLTGVPGLAKTLLIRSLAQALGIRGTKVILFHLLAREELEPRIDDEVVLVDQETGAERAVDGAAYARLHAENLARVRADIEQVCHDTETEYCFLPTDQPLDEGRAFTLTARVSGVPVGKVTLYRQDSPKPLAEAAPDQQGLVRLAVDGLDGPTGFVVRGGDGQSAPLHIKPYPLPRINAFEIAVIPPAYAAHAWRTNTVPSFSALRGSRLRYRLHLKAPAVSVAVERSAPPPKEERVSVAEQAKLKRCTFGQRIGVEDPAASQPASPVFRPDAADPLVWEADWDLSAMEDIVYRLAIKGWHGDLVRNDEPWRINVVSDNPPLVRIQSHNGPEVIRVGNETVTFKLSAVDDVRVTGARLVFRKPGQPHTRQEIKLPADTGRTYQRQNAEYVGMIERPVEQKGLADLAAALRKARLSMEAAARVLDKQPAVKAVPDEEAALGALVDASKLLEEAKDALAPAEGEGQLTFTLRPPSPKSSTAQGKEASNCKSPRKCSTTRSWPSVLPARRPRKSGGSGSQDSPG